MINQTIPSWFKGGSNLRAFRPQPTPTTPAQTPQSNQAEATIKRPTTSFLGTVKAFPGSFRETWKNIIPKVGNFMGVAPLGTALGETAALLSGDVRKQKESEQNLVSITEKLFERANQLPPGDPKRAWYLKTAQENYAQLGKENKAYIDRLPTTKQIVGASVNTALWITALGRAPKIPGMPNLGAVTAGKTVGQRFINAGVKYGTQALKDTSIGAVWLTGGKVAAGEKVDWQKTAGESLLLGAAPLAAGVVATGLAKGIGAVAKPIGRAISGGVRKIESAAAGKTVEELMTKSKDANELMLSTIGDTTTKQRLAQGAMTVINGIKSIPQKFVDRFSPLWKVDKETYISFRLAQPAADGIAEGRLAKLFGKNGTLEPFVDVQRQTIARLRALDMLDRSSVGLETTGHLQSADILKIIQGQISKNGKSEGKVLEAIAEYNKFTDDNLKLLLTSGRINARGYAAIKAKHPNYIPNNVLHDFEIDGFGGTGSMNVGTTPLKGAKTGSLKTIEDPDVALIRQTQAIHKFDENNRAIGSLVKNFEGGAKIEGMRPVRTAAQVEEQQKLFQELSAQKSQREVFLKESRGLKGEIKTANKQSSQIIHQMDKIQGEVDTLIEEARVRASDLENPRTINSLLRRASQNETRSIAWESKLASKVENQTTAESALKEVNDLIKEKNQIRQELWQELRATKLQSKQTTEQTINYWRNGTKEIWVVPNDIAIAVKNLDAQTTNWVMKVATYPAKVLKNFATRFNVTFSMTNLPRDRQTAYMTARAMTESLGKNTSANADLLRLSKKEFDALYKNLGGYGGSIFREGKPVDILKEFRRKGWRQFSDKVNPFEIVNTLNESIEDSTRKMVFRVGLEGGLSPKNAIFVSREATVDFAKMGTWMKNLNQAIPFLNARVQGGLNMFRAMKMSPEIFARTATLSAVYPQLAIYQWNRQFESSNQISTYIWENYWPIIVGEKYVTDPTTGLSAKTPIVVTIRKGEIQQAISNPIYYFMAKNDGNDFRSVSQMLVDNIGNISPLSVSSFGNTNPWLQLISNFGPLGTVPMGMATNINSFTGSKIVPEEKTGASPALQFTKYDSELVKKVGAGLNISPAKIDFALNSFGGGVQDIVSVLSMAYSLSQGQGIGTNIPDESAIGQATKLPITRTLIREPLQSQGPQYKQQQVEKQEVNQQTIDRGLLLREVALEIDHNLMGMKTNEARLEYLNSIKATLTPEIKSKLQTIQQARVAYDTLKTSDSVETRARFIDLQIKQMKAGGASAQDLLEYLANLKIRKLLTADVIKILSILSR